jgi:hypothetical protein
MLKGVFGFPFNLSTMNRSIDILISQKEFIANSQGLCGVISNYNKYDSTILDVSIQNSVANPQIFIIPTINNTKTYLASDKSPQVGDTIMVLDDTYFRKERIPPQTGAHFNRIKNVKPGMVGKVITIATSTKNIGIEFDVQVGSTPGYQSCQGKAKVGCGCFLYPSLVVVIGDEITPMLITMQTPDDLGIDEFLGTLPNRVDIEMHTLIHGEVTGSSIKPIKSVDREIEDLSQCESSFNEMCKSDHIISTIKTQHLNEIHFDDIHIQTTQRVKIQSDPNHAILL